VAYTTAALVKTYCGISGAGDDTLIANLVTYAQQIIDSYCNRTFEGSNADRSFDVGKDTDGYNLYFDEDLASINTVTNGDASSTTISSSEYVTMPRNRTPYYGIRIKSSSGKIWEFSTDPEGAITVNGVWAYSASAPDDIVHACTRLATFLYRQKDSSMDIDRPILTDAGVTLLPAGLPNDVKALLAPYRRL